MCTTLPIIQQHQLLVKLSLNRLRKTKMTQILELHQAKCLTLFWVSSLPPSPTTFDPTFDPPGHQLEGGQGVTKEPGRERRQWSSECLQRARHGDALSHTFSSLLCTTALCKRFSSYTLKEKTLMSLCHLNINKSKCFSSPHFLLPSEI